MIRFLNVAVWSTENGFSGKGTVAYKGSQSSIEFEVDGRDIEITLNGKDLDTFGADNKLVNEITDHLVKVMGDSDADFQGEWSEWSGTITNDKYEKKL